MDIELGDAVAALRDELVEAAARGSGERVEFVVGPVELEFGFELRRDAKQKAGFKAWVVSADTEDSAVRGRTHKVKVTLAPRPAGGGDLLVAGERARPEGPLRPAARAEKGP
ncbi:trypco2 family protein [Amycolatopsis sp. WGS_07]|uniref:trypco2 family protein n=1 Tax=Amycolatopsis sp. WGS_07 TaxID=3076764 RepID=UPI003873A0C8